MSSQNLSYYNFSYDNTKDYIDEFNKNILKSKFGFYQTEENPNNYYDDKKRYINNDDIKKIYDERYLKNSILYENLSLEIYNMITYYNNGNNFESQKMYEGYLYKVQNQIRAENKRIQELINKLSIFIFVYNYYY